MNKKYKSKILSSALSIGLIFSIPFSAAANDSVQFMDVDSSNSHYDSITNLVKMGAIHGYTLADGTKEFRPYNKITRSQAAQLFTKALNLPVPTNISEVLSNYKDVDSNNYFADAIAATYQAGIFHGSQGNFNDGPLTREQMATVIAKAFNLQDNGKDPGIYLGDVSPSHQPNVKLLAEYGITNQLADFRPSEVVTRGQFATFLYKSIEINQAPSDNNGGTTTDPTGNNGGTTTNPTNGSGGTPTQCTNDGATYTGYNRTYSFNPKYVSVNEATQDAINYGLPLDYATTESSFNSAIANKCKVVQTGGALFYFDNSTNMAVVKWFVQIVVH